MKIGLMFSAIVTFLLFITLMSFIPTFLWYTFDDRLATVTGNPMWGEIPFWNVYGFTWFVSCLCKSTSSSGGK